MGKIVSVAAFAAMLVFAGWGHAAVSIVMNGSFENSGLIGDITEEAPQSWCDVSLAADKFGGKVEDDWSAYGDYSLELWTEGFETFTAGDMATVSQEVYLTEASKIIFDLRLSSSYSTSPWDPNKRSALVMIDDIIVWDSNDWPADANDEYHNQEVDLGDFNGVFDTNSHWLSLAIRVNVDEDFYSYSPKYKTQWDFVKFDAHCGGFGYLAADFNRDCYVDFSDFAVLAGQWLEGGIAYEDDLILDGVIDGLDLMFLAQDWLNSTYWQDWQKDNCYEAKLLASDIKGDGIVNFQDFAVIVGQWGGSGDCLTADVDNSGEVDYGDILVLTEQWLQMDWAYGLE